MCYKCFDPLTVTLTGWERNEIMDWMTAYIADGEFNSVHANNLDDANQRLMQLCRKLRLTKESLAIR